MTSLLSLVMMLTLPRQRAMIYFLVCTTLRSHGIVQYEVFSGIQDILLLLDIILFLLQSTVLVTFLRPCPTQSVSSTSVKIFLPPRSLGGNLILLGEYLLACTPRWIFLDSTVSSAKIFWFLGGSRLSRVPRWTIVLVLGKINTPHQGMLLGEEGG